MIPVYFKFNGKLEKMVQHHILNFINMTNSNYWLHYCTSNLLRLVYLNVRPKTQKLSIHIYHYRFEGPGKDFLERIELIREVLGDRQTAQ